MLRGGGVQQQAMAGGVGMVAAGSSGRVSCASSVSSKRMMMITTARTHRHQLTSCGARRSASSVHTSATAAPHGYQSRRNSNNNKCIVSLNRGHGVCPSCPPRMRMFVHCRSAADDEAAGSVSSGEAEVEEDEVASVEDLSLVEPLKGEDFKVMKGGAGDASEFAHLITNEFIDEIRDIYGYSDIPLPHPYDVADKVKSHYVVF